MVTRRLPTSFAAWCLLFLIVAGGALTWEELFGTTVVDNRGLGLLRYERSWGRVRTITCDKNRDGVVDAIYHVYTSSRLHVPTVFEVREAWESKGLDGHFDIHYFRDADGILRAERDADGDGTYERATEIRPSSSLTGGSPVRD